MKYEKFFDEQIIDMINEAEQNDTDSRLKLQNEEEPSKETPKSTIEDGVKIQGKWVTFEKCSLANDTIAMMVPKIMEPMNLERAKIKYPSEHRPETILTNDIGTVNLLLQYMDGEVDNTTIEIFRTQVFTMMKRVNGTIKERTIGAVDVKGTQIAYVEFTNSAIDGKLYNLMFYVPVQGKPLMGSFNCMTKEMKYWKDIAMEMMQSIELVEKDHE